MVWVYLSLIFIPIVLIWLILWSVDKKPTAPSYNQNLGQNGEIRRMV